MSSSESPGYEHRSFHVEISYMTSSCLENAGTEATHHKREKCKKISTVAKNDYHYDTNVCFRTNAYVQAHFSKQFKRKKLGSATKQLFLRGCKP